MNKTKQEIEDEMKMWLKLRTEVQRKVRSSTADLETVENKLKQLLRELGKARS
jgi:hypothetical protein